MAYLKGHKENNFKIMMETQGKYSEIKYFHANKNEESLTTAGLY